jgi:hypothetical protein
MTLNRGSAYNPTSTSDSKLVSKAVLKAAKKLEISNAELAEIIGSSPSKLTRMNQGTAEISKSGKEFDIALLFIRLYRSLDAITGGDNKTCAAWIRNNHDIFKQPPIEEIKKIEGLVYVVQYLDSRRAII